ncbi:MAG: flagellar basal-body rod protein FlgF [Caulobacteraceae bacterium]
MDNTLYVGLSRQMTLRRELDVIANNIANADTAGFKLESLMVSAEEKPLSGGGVSSAINFNLDSGVARDFSQGGLKQTGATYDLAVEGEGFFKIGTDRGERYTRDGRFAVDGVGKLVNASGHAVLDDGGGEITLDPVLGDPTIGADGTVSQKGQVVGKVGVARFGSLAALSKDGDGLYRNVSNLQPETATDSKVRQGMIETSNVQPIVQITRLIEVSRTYETIARLMGQASDLSSRSIERLGRVS